MRFNAVVPRDLLTNGAESAPRATRILVRRQSQVTGEVPTIGKAARIADERHQCRCGDQSNARNGLQAIDSWHLGREPRQLPLHGRDGFLEPLNLITHVGQHRVQRLRNRNPLVDFGSHGRHDAGCPDLNRDAKLPKESAQGVQPRRARGSQVARSR